MVGKPHFKRHFLCFLPVSLNPGIQIFWNFIFVISLTLSNTSRKLHVSKQSSCSCVVGIKALFLDCFLGIFGVSSRYVSSDTLIWTASNFSWMHSNLGTFILKSKMFFSRKLCWEGLISICWHDLCVFAHFQPLLEKSLMVYR